MFLPLQKLIGKRTDMNKYNLGFISDEDIYNHVKTTVKYFHQNLFHHIGNGWKTSVDGFDVANEERHIYSLWIDNPLELKDKERRYIMIKMFDCLLKDKEAECYVVDTADTSSRTFLWSYEAEGQFYQHEHIHGVSLGTFYDIALDGERCLRKIRGVLQDVLISN